jgi:DNA-binding transcriptional LysR family regulator
MQLVRHLEKLYYFGLLTRYRSMSEGAVGIGISQAGLSKSIASLEDVLNVQLFVRSSTGLALTKEGELLLAATMRIFNDANEVEMQLIQLKSMSTPNRLRIGIYDSIAVYLWSDLNLYLQKFHPHVDIELTVDKSASLFAAMNARLLDIAIGVNLASEAHGRHIYTNLFVDNFSFFIAPFSMSGKSTLPVLLHPGVTDRFGVPLEKNFELPAQRKVHRVLNFETLKRLTVQGFGIGLIPHRVAESSVRLNQLQELDEPLFPASICPHDIGMLSTSSFRRKHSDFLDEIGRFAAQWPGTSFIQKARQSNRKEKHR